MLAGEEKNTCSKSPLVFKYLKVISNRNRAQHPDHKYRVHDLKETNSKGIIIICLLSSHHFREQNAKEIEA
jgi:hypothetical protein